MTNALIIVDVQNDFCESGSLAVAGGAEVASKIRKYVLDGDANKYELVIASRDTHNAPPLTNSGHFSESPNYVTTWPAHCVKGTYGWQYHANLGIQETFDFEIEKGQGVPAYSAFEGSVADQDPWRNGDFIGATLGSLLRAFDIERVDVVGLAFDHCVRATAIDAAKLGFITKVIKPLTASVTPDNDLVIENLLNSNDVEVIDTY